MNKEIQAQWVADLRDGTRRQGTGHLRNVDGGQCCLDVLCEQAVKAGIIPAPVLNISDGVFHYHWGPANDLRPEGVNDESELLPSIVADWAGLEETDVEVTFVNPRYEAENDEGDLGYDFYGNERLETETLAELNDSWQLSFPEIADIIEKFL